MKTSLTDEKLLFFVLGIPRSGTTIVGMFFNSLTDGFCLGEPHWYLHSGHTDDGAYGKVKEYYREVTDPKLIMQTNIIPILQKGPFCVGGYKATWHRGNREEMTEIIESHLSLVDFFIVVFRNPVLTLSSLRATDGWEYREPGPINKDYDYLDKLAQHPKGNAVVFEDFCNQPLAYMKSRIPFEVQGSFNLSPTGHAFGDERANRSTGIEVHARHINIGPVWIDQLAPARRIWERWKM